MYKLPPDRRRRLSSTDVLIAIVLPYINLIVAFFYLARPESKKRGLQMLALSTLAAGLYSVAWWWLFAGMVEDSSPVSAVWGWLDKLITSSLAEPLPWLWGWTQAAWWVVLLRVLCVLAVPFLIARYVQGRRLARAWRILAERAGLEYQPGGCLGALRGRVIGTYRGRSLRLYTYSPTMDNVLDATSLDLKVDNPTGLCMRLEYTPLSHVIDRFLKSQDQVKTGDAAFDAAFVVQSEQLDLVSLVLASPDVRRNLMRLREYTTLELGHTYLSLDCVGRERDVDYLHFCFDLLSDVADVVEQIHEEA